MEKNPGMFSSKNVISLKDMKILEDMWVSKLSGNVYSGSELVLYLETFPQNKMAYRWVNEEWWMILGDKSTFIPSIVSILTDLSLLPSSVPSDSSLELFLRSRFPLSCEENGDTSAVKMDSVSCAFWATWETQSHNYRHNAAWLAALNQVFTNILFNRTP